MFRHKFDKINNTLLVGLPGDSTAGNFASSDRGKLVTMSSNKLSILQGSSLAPTVPVVGIFDSVETDVPITTFGTFSVSAGSTYKIYCHKIMPEEELLVDVSTTLQTGTGDMLDSTSIGYYFSNCSSDGVSASATTNGILGSVLDPNKAAAVANTSHWLKLTGFTVAHGWDKTLSAKTTSKSVATIIIPTSNLG